MISRRVLLAIVSGLLLFALTLLYVRRSLTPTPPETLSAPVEAKRPLSLEAFMRIQDGMLLESVSRLVGPPDTTHRVGDLQMMVYRYGKEGTMVVSCILPDRDYSVTYTVNGRKQTLLDFAKPPQKGTLPR